ncbi:hypothetical protein [Arthrobacter russicus]|uniref:Sulfur carrier protein ThiS n=1 Tax=Arthrobacter russicus TaxID=172040 RepID=A0ABU1J924_9MICC|nr:hypothetical protein [Arthrobacter russicus]MDR6268927.1 sulfur carrier protein ThiS [Arthrobacter russicus]
MADLSNLETQTATVRTYQGVVVASGGTLAVNVNGRVIPARWADPIIASVGDTVRVEISSGATGQGQAFVTSRLTNLPRPGTGKVKTNTPGTIITVTGTDGIDYPCTFLASYTPTAGDNVALDWRASQGNVLGKVGVIAPPTPAGGGVTPPPAQPQTGTSVYAASDSATFGSFGWDRWAGGGGNIYQGSYGAGPLYGAWFYSGSPRELAGRTINRVQFTLGARRTVGSYNSPVAVHFYGHTSPTRPGADVARVAGPFDVTIPPGWAGGVVDLPTSFGAALQSGGGISITGEPYAGFLGRYQSPSSGTLSLDWTR